MKMEGNNIEELNRKVYVVTGGEYSSYHIERIFSKREDAERYSDAIPNTSVETYFIDDLGSVPYISYGVYLTDNLIETRIRVADFDVEPVNDAGEDGLYKKLDDGDYYFKVVLDIHKANPKLVVKIVSEWYTQIKANHLELKYWGLITHGKEIE